MNNKKTEPRLFEVSREYRADINEEMVAIARAIGVEDPESPCLRKNEVRIDIREETSGSTIYRRRRVRGVHLQVFLHTTRDYARRLIYVKDGFLNLDTIDHKIDELSSLKACDDGQHDRKQADLARSLKADQALQARAEAEGLRVSILSTGLSADEKSCLWGVSGQRLVLLKHPGLSLEQAMIVQQLLESFSNLR